MVIFFLLLLASCRSAPAATTPPLTSITALPPNPSVTFIIPTATYSAAPSISPSPYPPTLTPSASPTTIPAPTSFTVYYHPDDVLFVGDQVSLEVVSPPGLNVQDASLQAQVDPPSGPRLGLVKFGPWGIEGRYEAALIWAWDTKAFSAGGHTLVYTVQPQGYSWTEQVSLLPAGDMPASQADSHWSETTTKCCTLFYITGTASERDLASLTSLVDAQAQDAAAKMEAEITQPITITVLPRLLGNGGFTSSEISVSYLDRNYASNDWALVVHHEMIHAIDGRLGGDFRPTLFVEGLAVYLTGGHYRTEPLMPQAAALLPGYLSWYLPLKPLADDFYASQHEIGYLEASSLIEYMVKTYGTQDFFAFYRDIHNKQGQSQSDSIDAALKAHFSISFAQLEQDFITALKNEPDTSSWVENVRLEVTYYDTMRRYQQLLDPSAYFRTAWLLDNKNMRERGIVADYLRHPHTPTNLALETLFITAGQQMSSGEFSPASVTLDEINKVLDGIQHGAADPFSTSSMASDYLSIASLLQQQEFDVQNITVSGNTAVAQVTTLSGPSLIQLDLQRSGGKWSVTP